jgi:membrane protein CcdC involved in cytochrome C biogenesis
MIAPLSLSNILTVFMAIACLWSIAPQARGDGVKLWRVAVPPGFAIAQALVLLAGVFDATVAHDAEWLAAGVFGAVLGRMRGWALSFDVDRASGLIKVQPSIDVHLAAIGLVVLAAIDFTSASFEDPIVATDLVAAGAAFLAGYLSCRALAVAVRVARATPPSSTPAGTSLPPS